MCYWRRGQYWVRQSSKALSTNMKAINAAVPHPTTSNDGGLGRWYLTGGRWGQVPLWNLDLDGMSGGWIVSINQTILF